MKFCVFAAQQYYGKLADLVSQRVEFVLENDHLHRQCGQRRADTIRWRRYEDLGAFWNNNEPF